METCTFKHTARIEVRYAETDQIGAPVLELNVKFKQPTHYGEFVDIETTMIREGSLKFRFEYKVFVNGNLCTTGSTLHCMTKGGRPTRELPSGFSKFEFVNE